MPVELSTVAVPLTGLTPMTIEERSIAAFVVASYANAGISMDTSSTVVTVSLVDTTTFLDSVLLLGLPSAASDTLTEIVRVSGEGINVLEFVYFTVRNISR
jgi:hypothetical protein